MKKTLLLPVFIFLLNFIFAQNTKTWVGANNGMWGDVNNWAPVGIPGNTDTVIFNSLNVCELDVSPVIASFRANGVGGSLISSSATRSITINNHGALTPVFNVAAGATLSIGNGGAFNIFFSTYDLSGSGVNNAQVAGTLIFGFASGWVINNVGATLHTDTDITGTISVLASHTSTLFYNSTSATVHFLSSSGLLWDRDGGTIPAADYQDGSVINVTGVTNTMVAFSTSTNYNGLIIWNAAAQAASLTGAAAQLLPTGTYPMDSIRVVNTGLGTLRLTTDPAGFNLGHIEVRGGTLEISAPGLIPSTKTGTIATDLVISGGNVFLNATFSGDVAGAAGSMQLTVNRDIIISGGTLNLTNRPMPATFGAGQINVTGHVLQTGGTITATSLLGAQNYINMNGGAVQNLEMDNVTGQVNLVIANNVSGVNLLNMLVLPRALNLTAGFLSLNNFDVSVPSPFLSTISNGRIVTNGTGSAIIRLMPANSSTLFPVAVSSTRYNPVTIVSQPAAVTNDYSVRVEPGNNPAGIYNPTRTIDRTWYVSSATNISAGLVGLSFQYATADANASCLPAANMELGHFIPGSPGAWNLDPSGNLTPTATGPYVAGPFAPGSLGSSFVVGNVGSILAVEKLINLIVEKQNNKAYLSWTIDNIFDVRDVAIERSADGRNFIPLVSVGTTVHSFDDDKLLYGLNYYRIKITNLNGNISYSMIVVLLNKEKGFDIIGLLPSLVANNAILNVTAAQKTKMNVVVTDITGRQLQKNTYQLITGSNQLNINFSGLGTGTYQVTGYTAEGMSKTIRFVKQ
ncbi:hypothetical protein [Ferruginibacter sp. SUN106]|uniref:hypothetical protein n=1 Tax=Ferruginibacter sp. SUN106 TaxID=2978348 RepID=UPI003D36BA0B